LSIIKANYTKIPGFFTPQRNLKATTSTKFKEAKTQKNSVEVPVIPMGKETPPAYSGDFPSIGLRVGGFEKKKLSVRIPLKNLCSGKLMVKPKRGKIRAVRGSLIQTHQKTWF